MKGWANLKITGSGICLKAQGKIIIVLRRRRRKRRQELRSDSGDENVFHLCEIWGFHRRVADSYTLLGYDTTQKDNRIWKFPANTLSLSSRRVHIPNKIHFTSFYLLKTRKGRFFETSRNVAIQLPKDAASYPRRTSLLFPYSKEWFHEVLSVPTKHVLCIPTIIMEGRKLPCVGSERIWMAFSKSAGIAASRAICNWFLT